MIRDLPVFSPFSPATIWKKQNRALLLQFLVAEFINALQAFDANEHLRAIFSPQKRFFPYDWAQPYGALNKAQEHALILTEAFPEVPRAVKRTQRTLNKVCAAQGKVGWIKKLQDAFVTLEPFLSICKDDENLIFFLVQRYKEIDGLMHPAHTRSLLLKLHTQGFLELCKKLCDNYHRRGFFFLIPELKSLLAQLEHD